MVHVVIMLRVSWDTAHARCRFLEVDVAWRLGKVSLRLDETGLQIDDIVA